MWQNLPSCSRILDTACLNTYTYTCVCESTRVFFQKVLTLKLTYRSSTVTNITSRDLICQQRQRTKSLWRYHYSFRLGSVIYMYVVTLSLIHISSYTCRPTVAHDTSHINAASFLVDTHRHAFRQITVVYRQICWRAHIYWSIVYCDVQGETQHIPRLGLNGRWQKGPAAVNQNVVENTALSKARQLNSTF
jgi:hypothetical protein